MGADGHGKRGLSFADATPAQATVAFVRACEDAGVSDFSLHDLPRYYASMLRQKGVELHTLQKLLGHSDPRMSDRYAHLSPEFLLDATKRLDGVLIRPAKPRPPGLFLTPPGRYRHLLPRSRFPFKYLILFGVPDGI